MFRNDFVPSYEINEFPSRLLNVSTCLSKSVLCAKFGGYYSKISQKKSKK